MHSNQDSNILIFITGHGGDEFLKFHDNDEISAMDFQNVFMEMHLKMRYKSILFIVETCQAATISKYITAPNVFTLASSLAGENSYSYYANSLIGVSVIDRFTYSLGRYFDISVRNHLSSLQSSYNHTNDDISANNRKLSRQQRKEKKTFKHLLQSFSSLFLHSTASFQMSDFIGQSADYRHINDQLDVVLSQVLVMPYFQGTRMVKYFAGDPVTVDMNHLSWSLDISVDIGTSPMELQSQLQLHTNTTTTTTDPVITTDAMTDVLDSARLSKQMDIENENVYLHELSHIELDRMLANAWDKKIALFSF